MISRPSTHTPWIEVEDLPELPDEVTDATKTAAVQVASDVLFQLSGRQWPGIGQDVLRPPAHWRGPDAVSWRLELPYQPVVSIVAVTIEGVTVDPSEYGLVDGRHLVRYRNDADELIGWPTEQDLSVELGGERTWSVTYTHGADPPVGGVRSAITLAEQLARAWTPSQEGCRLGKATRTIARQGVTVALDDPMALFRDGMTGLRDVDLWLASLRHGESGRPSAVVDVAGSAPGGTRPRFRR